MFYTLEPCPICSGPVCFSRALDNVSIALACKDCDSTWDAPDHIDAAHAVFPTPALACDPTPARRWASQAEIELRGWMLHIAGEIITPQPD